MIPAEHFGDTAERLWLPSPLPPWTPEAGGVAAAIAAYPTTQFAVAEAP